MRINIGGEKGKPRGGLKGWKIVDIRQGADYVLNVMKQRLPFPDQSVEAIYTSHTLEHIFPDKLYFVFGEMFRVLQPRGRIRIVVPDIARAIRAYMEKDGKYLRDKRNPTKPAHYPPTMISYLMAWFHSHTLNNNERNLIGGHYTAFDREQMDYFLQRAGFKQIEYMKYGVHSYHFQGCDFPRYKKCSIYVEATK